MKKEEKKKGVVDVFTGGIMKATMKYTHRVLVGIPVTGLVRVEWVLARYGQVIPCNWSQVEAMHWYDSYSPLGFQVADGRNIIAQIAVKENFEWLLFIDHDVILTRTTILKWNERMLRKDAPVFGGLYFTKSVPAEPLVYRGRGTSYFNEWKLGDEVWVDGMGMGNTMIHVSLLKAMYEESEEYQLGPNTVRRVFETPSKIFYDPEKDAFITSVGTEDLAWCSRVINDGYLKKSGWDKFQKKQYPFLVDTSIFCRHIDQDGVQYPSQGEEKEFARKK